MMSSVSTKRVDYWNNRWKDGDIPWHCSVPNPYILKYFDLLTNGSTEHKSILIPLCGKSKDMLSFYEKGLSVIGVELSQKAVKEFFTDHNLSYTVKKFPSYDEYCNDDGRIKIFCCEFFDFNVSCCGGELFDYLWDFRAIVAIHPELHQKYINHIHSLLKPSGKGLLECFEYEFLDPVRPPVSISKEKLTHAMKGLFEVTEITRCEEKDLPPGQNFSISDDCLYVLYLITCQ